MTVCKTTGRKAAVRGCACVSCVKIRAAAAAWRRRVRREQPERARRWRRMINERNHRIYREERETVLRHYAGGVLRCSCCGLQPYEFLTLEHVNGGGRQHRQQPHVRGGQLYHWLIRQNFPPGYDVLCYNCNCVKRVYDICPHQRVPHRE